MDDYNVNVLSEAKNEYSSRLVTILSPLMIEGIKSIFDEACKLCLDNDENEKYLMTFQNFLSRVPKWNSNIIDEETKRIITQSKCSYLEDLLTCVHITQLKILTSIRVSQKQKKIDIDIPKLNIFIHKCYISFARKIYSNVYLFEKDIMPLTFQKNMRETELICQESILRVIRDNMPVETILRAYIDQTVDEEIIEETVEKTVEKSQDKIENVQNTDQTSTIENKIKPDIVKTEETNKEMNTVEKPKLESITSEKKDAEQTNEAEGGQTKEKEAEQTKEKEAEQTKEKEVEKMLEKNDNQKINLIIQTPVDKSINNKDGNVNNTKNTTPASTTPQSSSTQQNNNSTNYKRSLSFDDKDTILNMQTNKKSVVDAPKTLERLEKISKMRHAQRKAEEEAEEEAEEKEEEEEEEKIVIGPTLDLDNSDIHDLNKKVNLQPDPILDDIEVLS
tara:strand:- start:5949 stop:7292 length:1344 start_codon:yes stop_codon:yes gene_type:complete